jgi:cytochrome c peroxidase
MRRGSTGETPSPDEAGLSRLELIGKRIFFDTSLSNPAGQACGSCHVPATAFAGNFGSTVGVPFAADGMTLGLRNTPTAMYASFTPPSACRRTERNCCRSAASSSTGARPASSSRRACRSSPRAR